jgi:hypothetical protein
MKLSKSFLFVVLSFSLFSVSFLTLTPLSVIAQDTKIALQRGYRTGYSDGYMSGYRDSIENAAKGFDKHSEYTKADRAYMQNYGSLEDYRDGYQQGFETGYNTGFEKRSFDAALPISLNKRGVVAVAKTPVESVAPVETAPAETVIEPKVPETTVAETIAPTETAVPTEEVSENTPADSTTAPSPIVNASYSANNGNALTIPTDTELIVELLGDINTEKSAVGDKFQARVVSPSELSGAIIEGRISKIQKPGRIKRRAEVSLSFDRIVLTEKRWSNFNAILTEVLPQKGDNIKRVDTEGTIEGRSSVKSDITKISASTGTGLVVGAIAGGPVGAAVGTGVGAAFGVGAVVVDRGKHIRINKDQQIRIRSVYETQIR